MSKLFRMQAAYLRAENKKHTEQMVPMNIEIVPDGSIAAWRSCRFLVQLFEAGAGGQRISINRTMVDEQRGGWLDGITWDEIQTIKRRIGFGDRYAVEIYPDDGHIVNVANMRHIWLVDTPPFAWQPSRLKLIPEIC